MTDGHGRGTAKTVTPSAGVVASGIAACVLVGLLIVGVTNVATTLSAPPAAAAAVAPEALPIPTGDEAPVEDPSTPPDRDSDQPEAVEHSSTVYVVKRGDTLTAISALHGVSVDAIATFNAISDRNVISSGEHLRIPIIYQVP